MQVLARPVAQMRVDPLTSQRRLTVFFRAIMAIPLFFALGIIGIAAFFVVIFAWFASLFLGRNPAHGFLTGYLRFYSRTYAYAFLLTDRYPPFNFEQDPSYAVDIEIPEGSLNRVTVFFRLILAFPVLVFQAILTYGLVPLAFIGWVGALFTGRLPSPFYFAFRGTLRFVMRVNAYFYLVQDPYPGGLFGDVRLDAAPPLSLSPTAAPGAAADSWHAAYAVDAPPAEAPSGLLGSLPVAPPLAPEQAVPEGGWAITMTKGGRTTIIIQIVLGALLLIGGSIANVAALSNVREQQWSDSYASQITDLDNAVSETLPTMTATPPTWSAVSTDCQTISSALDSLSNVPQYPSAGPNAVLLQGLSNIFNATQNCTAAAANQDSRELATAASLYSTGSNQLTVFLSEIPTPSGY